MEVWLLIEARPTRKEDEGEDERESNKLIIDAVSIESDSAGRDGSFIERSWCNVFQIALIT